MPLEADVSFCTKLNLAMNTARPRLGLGCSRFGSLVDGVECPDAIRLVHAALDLGITLFDTANIYGQGDSERFLGQALAGKEEVTIVTKAGQHFPLAKRLIIPAKKMLKPIVNKMRGPRAAAARARARAVPREWSRVHLALSLDASLKRLRRDRVGVFLLHSPDAETILAGEAMSALMELKAIGKAEKIGVSIDDEAAAAAALNDPRIEVIQLPLHAYVPEMAILAERARTSGRLVIIREIMAGAGDSVRAEVALSFAARQPADFALLGTRSSAHLRAAWEVLEGC